MQLMYAVIRCNTAFRYPCTASHPGQGPVGSDWWGFCSFELGIAEPIADTTSCGLDRPSRYYLTDFFNVLAWEIVHLLVRS